MSKNNNNQFPNWQLHRGFWKAGYRENTMEAFVQVKAQGCDMVEMDLQISRDGILHCFHDYNLKRIFKIDKKINRLTSQELSDLGIPRFVDVLTSDETPSHLNVEVKSIDLFAYKIIGSLASVLNTESWEKKLLISSFNPMCLFWIKKMIPSLPRALIIGDPRLLFSWMFKVSFLLASPKFLNVRQELLEKKPSRMRIESFGCPLMVWTVNDYQKAENLLNQGVTSIISDQPPPKNK